METLQDGLTFFRWRISAAIRTNYSPFLRLIRLTIKFLIRL